MTPARLIVLPDTPRDDPELVTLISPWDQPPIPIMSYLEITDSRSGRRFFAQTSAAQLNIGRGGQDGLNLDAFERLLRPEPRFTLDACFVGTRLYRAQIIGEIRDGAVVSHGVRPDAGALAGVAAASSVTACLALPNGERSFVIGTLLNLADATSAPIEVRLDPWRMQHHVGVCGATGAGKTETIGRIVTGCFDAGLRPIIIDLKPDYQEIDRPADMPDGRGLPGVRFFTLSGDGRGERVAIPPSALDLNVLAATVFHVRGEENMADTFDRVLISFDQHARNRGWASWYWDDLKAWVDKDAAKMADKLQGPGGLNSRTWEAVHNKLHYPRRLPGWVALNASGGTPLDALGPLGASQPSATLDGLTGAIMADVPLVIRIAKVDARSYGLFLSFLLRFVEEQREAGRLGPQLFVIDEAADIFSSESRHLSDTATQMLGRRLAKGRKLWLCFLIATQSADDIPITVRHNLNTMLVGRHRHPRVLKEALPDTGIDVAGVAARLRPGEMLADVFGSFSLLRVGMLRSPLRLG